MDEIDLDIDPPPLPPVHDGRSPEELIAAGAHRRLDGTIYLPRCLQGRERRQYLRLLLILEPESPDDADRRCADFVRAGGDVICEQCGEKYYDHPADPKERHLTILCDRSRVKL